MSWWSYVHARTFKTMYLNHSPFKTHRVFFVFEWCSKMFFSQGAKCDARSGSSDSHAFKMRDFQWNCTQKNSATWTYIRQTIQSMEFMNSFAVGVSIIASHSQQPFVRQWWVPDRGIFLQKVSPMGSIGMVYLPILILLKSTIHVPKYTSPMNAMGLFNL